MEAQLISGKPMYILLLHNVYAVFDIYKPTSSQSWNGFLDSTRRLWVLLFFTFDISN